MKTKFTRGEWKLVDGLIHTKDGLPLYHIDRPAKEREANAKLIAAAPDLLEALQQMCEARGEGIEAEINAYDKARLAIKKAIN